MSRPPAPEEVERLLRELSEWDTVYWIEERGDETMSNLRERALGALEAREMEARRRNELRRHERRARLDGLMKDHLRHLGVVLAETVSGIEFFDFQGMPERAECEVEGIRFRVSYAAGLNEGYRFVALECCERCGGCAGESFITCLEDLGRFLRLPPYPASRCAVCNPPPPDPFSDNPPEGAVVEHVTATLEELDRVFE